MLTSPTRFNIIKILSYDRKPYSTGSIEPARRKVAGHHPPQLFHL